MRKNIWDMLFMQSKKRNFYKIALCIIMGFLIAFSTDISFALSDISAKSAIVIENSTGKILYEKNAYEKLPMASTTKIMTALCAIENSDLNRLVKIDDRAVGIEGSSIYLAHGEVLTMSDLIYGVMLNSGNDAATAVAYEISGSVEEFAKLMNNTAKKIGAINTNFTNPSGLWEENHYTTAYDLALITSYALKNPFFREVCGSETKIIPNSSKDYDRALKNHNKLLSMYEGCTGVKTGYTKKCGRCLVSSAGRNGIELTCVTLNAPDDWNDHIKMLDFGFSRVYKKLIAKAGDYAACVTAQDGLDNICRLEFEKNLEYVCTLDGGEKVSLDFDIPKSVDAPVNAGTKIGKVTLICDGKAVCTSDLLVSKPVLEKPKENMKKIFGENIKKCVVF